MIAELKKALRRILETQPKPAVAWWVDPAGHFEQGEQQQRKDPFHRYGPATMVTVIAAV